MSYIVEDRNLSNKVSFWKSDFDCDPIDKRLGLSATQGKPGKDKSFNYAAKGNFGNEIPVKKENIDSLCYKDYPIDHGKERQKRRTNTKSLIHLTEIDKSIKSSREPILNIQDEMNIEYGLDLSFRNGKFPNSPYLRSFTPSKDSKDDFNANKRLGGPNNTKSVFFDP